MFIIEINEIFYLKNFIAHNEASRKQKLHLTFLIIINNRSFIFLLLQSDMFYYYLLAVYYAAGFYLSFSLSPSAVDPKWHFADFIFFMFLFNNIFQGRMDLRL